MYEEALRKLIEIVAGIDDETLSWLLYYTEAFFAGDESRLPRDFVEYLDGHLDYMIRRREWQDD